MEAVFITYCRGPTLVAARDFTRGDFVNVCQELAEAFPESCQFGPEYSPTGGIQWTWWPGKDTGAASVDCGNASNAVGGASYKTMRIPFEGWPWIYGDELHSWDGRPEILCSTGQKMHTFLRSLYNAPAWTFVELQTFGRVLARNGIMTKSYPDKIEIDLEEI
jgi:hypothetical protein